MTPEEQKTKCEKCKFMMKVSMRPWLFLGCTHKPYKGKWVAEIDSCPKEATDEAD